MERKEIRWRRHATVEQVQYEDGTGDLCNLTYKEPEGLEIVGNGSLQAPLTVRVKAGWSLVRDQAGEGEGSGANRPAIPLLSPAGAYSIASQWGSYVRAGDPGACFYSFKANDARPVSEAHRQACLDWADHCAERVKARSPYKPVDAVDLGALLALRAFFVAAELAP